MKSANNPPAWGQPKNPHLTTTEREEMKTIEEYHGYLMEIAFNQRENGYEIARKSTMDEISRLRRYASLNRIDWITWEGCERVQMKNNYTCPLCGNEKKEHDKFCYDCFKKGMERLFREYSKFIERTDDE